MRPAARLLAALLIAPWCAAAAPSPVAARPLVGTYDAPAITRFCDEGIARAEGLLAKMRARRGGGGLLAEWTGLQIAIEDTVGPVYLLGSVHPDKSVRDAADPCLSRFTALSTDIFQDEALYRRARAVRPGNAIEAKFRKDLLEGFEDTGVALAPDKRRRAKAIFDRLEELRQAYDRNIRDDPTRVTMSPADVAGMPESWIAARKKDGKGDFDLGLDEPTYVPFMANATSGAARERYYRAKLREGGEANLALLDEIYALRRELAGLYGLPDYASYVLRRRMAGSTENVARFLAAVKDAVGPVEKRELAELEAEKARETGASGDRAALARWDVDYYRERVRRARFAIEKEAMRRYFPTGKSVDFALAVSQALYGVKFREVKVPVWHPDVRYFDVLDAKSGAFVSGFYLDIYPREGKYTSAAAFPVRGASRLARRTPLSVLVANFDRVGLDHDELETLLHEFGHVLHGVLSRTDFNPQAGTSTLQDFVEAPSQMFEEWARREQPLALFATVCPECPRLSKEDIARLDAARRYGRGIFYARQWLYAAFDMELSTSARPALEVWKALESRTPLGHVEGTMLPASFTHLASNYAAGYYGYMWSQVLALDMLSAFKGNLLDAKVGARYRDTILSQGGQREPRDMVRAFLGREPSNAAFFAEVTGRR
jgi:thimet oligopeptidase